MHSLLTVLVIDWEIHHGNGIQNMFSVDTRVFYLSFHQLDRFPFNFNEACGSFVGKGNGTGFSMNVAWLGVGRQFFFLYLFFYDLFICVGLTNCFLFMVGMN